MIRSQEQQRTEVFGVAKLGAGGLCHSGMGSPLPGPGEEMRQNGEDSST